LSEVFNSDNNSQEVIREYKRIRPFYKKLVNEVRSILKKRIKDAEVKFSNISGRTKTLDSFKEKIERKRYDNPLEDIKDFAGVRVVNYYEKDLDKVKQIIHEEFDVYDYKDKTKDLGVDRMGYHGAHFIVTLGNYYKGEKYEDINRLYCEIQVRTVLQDSWALISHHLMYKDEASIPKRMRRDFNIVASLLEISQEVFDSIREKKEDYLIEIRSKEKENRKFLSQPVDYDTLYAYTKWKYKDLPVSETWHVRLLSDLNLEKYPTLKEIDDIVECTREAVEAYQKENPDWFRDGTAYITKSLGFGDKEFRAKHGFGQKTRDAFLKYEYLVKKQP